MNKTLVLCRHAHRDTTRRELDNGLTEKGRDQAKAIKRFFFERFTEEDRASLWLVSSPKQRCLETLAPLAKELERPVDAHPDLDEATAREGHKGLEARVERFLREWGQSNIALTILCSHGDWLPVATEGLLGLPQDVKKGSWLELEWGAGAPSLKWYIPSFKPFYK